jgi:hypothetical protein
MIAERLTKMRRVKEYSDSHCIIPNGATQLARVTIQAVPVPSPSTVPASPNTITTPPPIADYLTRRYLGVTSRGTPRFTHARTRFASIALRAECLEAAAEDDDSLVESIVLCLDAKLRVHTRSSVIDRSPPLSVSQFQGRSCYAPGTLTKADPDHLCRRARPFSSENRAAQWSFGHAFKTRDKTEGGTSLRVALW